MNDIGVTADVRHIQGVRPRPDGRSPYTKLPQIGTFSLDEMCIK